MFKCKDTTKPELTSLDVLKGGFLFVSYLKTGYFISVLDEAELLMLTANLSEMLPLTASLNDCFSEDEVQKTDKKTHYHRVGYNERYEKSIELLKTSLLPLCHSKIILTDI